VDHPAWLSDTALVAPVARLTGRDAVTIARWSCEPITGGMGETIGVWRVTGMAVVDNADAPFTVILKGWSVPPGSDDATAWDWPHRELRAYTSGLLEDLPGDIDAPACLAEVTAADGSVWAWLSPMSDGALACWDAGHFALVARKLGRFNGAYLTGEPLPRAGWLSRQWTRKWTEAAADAIDQLDVWTAHPLIAQAIPPAAAREIRRLWDERQRWFDRLDTLPRTFAHLDAFRRNTFLRPGPDGDLRPGLIDWGFAGIAAVGEEAVALVASSSAFGDAPGMSLDDLDDAVFPAYIAGLRDAGWTGDERLARLGYAGSLVMRYALGTLRAGLPMVATEELHPILERNFGMPLATIIDTSRARNEWAFDLAAEVRRILATLPPTTPGAA
jgi:hypothetical protein